MEEMRKLVILGTDRIPYHNGKMDLSKNTGLEAMMLGVKEAYRHVIALDKRIQVCVTDLDGFKKGKVERGFVFNPGTEKWEQTSGVKPDFVFARVHMENLKSFTAPKTPKQYEEENDFIFLNPPVYGEFVSDKIATYEALKNNKNVRMPKTETARTTEEAKEVLSKFGDHKVIMKPTSGHDAQGQRIFDSKEDAIKAAEEGEIDFTDGHVFQEYLPQAFNDSWRVHISTRRDPKTNELIMFTHSPLRKYNPSGRLADFEKHPETKLMPIDFGSKEWIKLRQMAKEVVKTIALKTDTLPQFTALDFAMIGEEGNKDPYFIEANYTPGVLRANVAGYDRENPSEEDKKYFKEIALALMNAANEITA